MKRKLGNALALIIIFLTVVLVSCLPNTPDLQGQRFSATDVQYSAFAEGKLIVATETEFDAIPADCSFIEQLTDQAECPAPGVYVFETNGAMSGQIIDGWRPVTRPVKVERWAGQ